MEKTILKNKQVCVAEYADHLLRLSTYSSIKGLSKPEVYEVLRFKLTSLSQGHVRTLARADTAATNGIVHIPFIHLEVEKLGKTGFYIYL